MGRMLAVNRHRQILDRAKAGDELTVRAIAAAFRVSGETVRRDLKALEAQGHLQRVFGGAVVIGRESPPIDDRATANATGKAAIGAIVASIVQPGMWVFVDSGTTALAAAGALATGPSLKVMTHMPAVAEAFWVRPEKGHHVELTGGVYDDRHRRLCGNAVFDAVRDRIFDLAILGVHGLTLENGVLDWGDAPFRLKRMLMTRSTRCIWLADALKFGQPAYHRTAAFEDVHTLVTDRQPAATYWDRLNDAGVTVLLPDRSVGEPHDRRSDRPAASARMISTRRRSQAHGRPTPVPTRKQEVPEC